jgi:hypothetical protein
MRNLPISSTISSALENTNTANSYNLKIIAQTGWTTTNLLSGITSQGTPTYDFVGLLIGVNNHQRINFLCTKRI